MGEWESGRVGVGAGVVGVEVRVSVGVRIGAAAAATTTAVATVGKSSGVLTNCKVRTARGLDECTA